MGMPCGNIKMKVFHNATRGAGQDSDTQTHRATESIWQVPFPGWVFSLGPSSLPEHGPLVSHSQEKSRALPFLSHREPGVTVNQASMA